MEQAPYPHLTGHLNPAPLIRYEWGMRFDPIDGAIHGFDRGTGLNLLVRTNVTRSLERRAPHALQVGLLTACNLACSFCYRDPRAPSRLTAEFLVDLLRQADSWGVRQVAFGGGEPLLFPDLAPMLRELHTTTELALNFTTNGTLLDERNLAELTPVVQEIRVSAYADNDYLGTIRRIGEHRSGVNLMVTPDSLVDLGRCIDECLEAGADNVLLLSYKGDDQQLLLSDADCERLSALLRRSIGMPLGLDVCLHPRLSDVPQLFERTDCGAADDFLVITPDQAVQACSFDRGRIPFADFSELESIYHDLREQRAGLPVGGCTRSDFSPHDTPDGVFLWEAFASNNSGSYTLLGEFRTPEDASRAAQLVDTLLRAHARHLCHDRSPITDWILAQFKSFHVPPSAPLRAFGIRNEVVWQPAPYWNEGHMEDEPVEVAAFGNQLGVDFGYCLRDFGAFDTMVETVLGARVHGWVDDDPLLSIVAEGGEEESIRGAERFCREVRKCDEESMRRFEAGINDENDPLPYPHGCEWEDPKAYGPFSFMFLYREYAWEEEEFTNFERDGDEVRIRMRIDSPIASSRELAERFEQHGFRNVRFALVPGSYGGSGQIGPHKIPEPADVSQCVLAAPSDDPVADAFLVGPYFGPVHKKLLELEPEHLASHWRSMWRSQADERWPDCQQLAELALFSYPHSKSWLAEVLDSYNARGVATDPELWMLKRVETGGALERVRYKIRDRRQRRQDRRPPRSRWWRFWE